MPSLQLQHELSSVLLAGMENGLRGKIAFAELPNGIDDRRLANPTPCGIRKNKDQLFWSHNAESRTEHPAFAKQSSLVDETGIEPATSSLRTRNH